MLEAQPVSEAGIAVSQFNQWQKIFFEQGAAAFETTRAKSAADEAKDKNITALGEKLQRKHEVLSELLEEHVQLVPAQDVLAERRDAIHSERDRKLEDARERRRFARQTTRTIPTPTLNPVLHNPRHPSSPSTAPDNSNSG